MVGLVTELDGFHFLLFHVEQQRPTMWRYRWRILPTCPKGYGEWREGKSDRPIEVMQPEIARCRVEAQWRDADNGEWRQVALLTLVPPRLRFRVRAKSDLIIQRETLTAVAAMEDGVAAYRLIVPDYGLRLYAGEEASLVGRADSIHPANYFSGGNQFRTNDPLLEVVNASRAFDGWRWTDGSSADCRLTSSVHRRTVNYFALKAS